MKPFINQLGDRHRHSFLSFLFLSVFLLFYSVPPLIKKQAPRGYISCNYFVVTRCCCCSCCCCCCCSCSCCCSCCCCCCCCCTLRPQKPRFSSFGNNTGPSDRHIDGRTESTDRWPDRWTHSKRMVSLTLTLTRT